MSGKEDSQEKKKSWPTEENLTDGQKENIEFNAQQAANKEQRFSTLVNAVCSIAVTLAKMEGHFGKIEGHLKQQNEFIMTGAGEYDEVDEETKTPFKRVLGEGTKEIIASIQRMKTNFSSEAIVRLIDEEVAKAAGLLTTEAGAHLVASNLGVDLGVGESPSALPENVESEEEIVDYFKKVLESVRTQNEESIPSDVIEKATILVEEKTVLIRFPFIPAEEGGKAIFAATSEALKELGGDWKSAGRDSHWLVPLPKS